MPTTETNVIQRKIALMGYPCVDNGQEQLHSSLKVERQNLYFSGKSSITLRFVQGHFPDAYDTTIEDCHSKEMRYQGRSYSLLITDTAGQQEYSLFPRSCSLDIHGYILVYAIDDRKSFEIIQTIHDKIMENVGGSIIPIVIVGNKLDLQHSSRAVTTDEGKRLATAWHAAFLETSAKDNTAVQTIFESMLGQIDKLNDKSPVDPKPKPCVIS